ncbi:multidrug resistance-associated protein 4-like protein [Lates japonicus]|uniref:Multidrug resistance-associated protein 4-like protein n=1 Tax=Lates japonicus TaxID=270547 RepID=A0AAD3M7M3_LATJO|nr:multidrug resistance-associated protein 4-like protein [Lates japonicus]
MAFFYASKIIAFITFCPLCPPWEILSQPVVVVSGRCHLHCGGSPSHFSSLVPSKLLESRVSIVRIQEFLMLMRSQSYSTALSEEEKKDAACEIHLFCYWDKSLDAPSLQNASSL